MTLLAAEGLRRADIIMYDAINQGDGTELISWRTTLPAFDASKERCFMRLRIEGK